MFNGANDHPRHATEVPTCPVETWSPPKKVPLFYLPSPSSVNPTPRNRLPPNPEATATQTRGYLSPISVQPQNAPQPSSKKTRDGHEANANRPLPNLGSTIPGFEDKSHPSPPRSYEHFGTSTEGSRTYPQKAPNLATENQGLMRKCS